MRITAGPDISQSEEYNKRRRTLGTGVFTVSSLPPIKSVNSGFLALPMRYAHAFCRNFRKQETKLDAQELS